MLYLALLTLTLAPSQFLDSEVSNTVRDYLSRLNLSPTRYTTAVTDQVPEGAALEHWVDASGRDRAIFLFDRQFLLHLSSPERRVVIAHEVGHLVPECRLLRRRINQEICADLISLQLVPVDDVVALLTKAVAMFRSSSEQRAFTYRLERIQENWIPRRKAALKTPRLRRLPIRRFQQRYCG